MQDTGREQDAIRQGVVQQRPLIAEDPAAANCRRGSRARHYTIRADFGGQGPTPQVRGAVLDLVQPLRCGGINP
ncbi:hypothetical protein GCM10009738_14320 [Kitasatospora viridis]